MCSVDFHNMKIRLHKDKSIGKVLFIVEGTKTEPYILKKLFTQVFDYQIDTKLRGKKDKQYNSKKDPYSKVYVINTQDSNIKSIRKDDGFLDNLFRELIEEYDFDIDNAAIFYVVDRDAQSNTDTEFLMELLTKLVNSRDNPDDERQGLLLLSYPSIESFTLSCFQDNAKELEFKTGQELKTFLGLKGINHQKIDGTALLHATAEMFRALEMINDLNYNLDNFSECNIDVLRFEERNKIDCGLYRCMSLFAICLLDLGLIELTPQNNEQ